MEEKNEEEGDKNGRWKTGVTRREGEEKEEWNEIEVGKIRIVMKRKRTRSERWSRH